jgi:hypothetical protein
MVGNHHVTSAVVMHATIEEVLYMVFYMQFMPRLCKEASRVRQVVEKVKTQLEPWIRCETIANQR